MEQYSQVWEHDYGKPESFIEALEKINASASIDDLTGMTIFWSEIPYDLRLFVLFYFSGTEQEARDFTISVAKTMTEAGSVYRGDLTGEDLTEAMSNRLLNMIGVVQDMPIEIPRQLATKAMLEQRGFRFDAWTAKNRVFLSHQHERKDRVQMLQQRLSADGISTWFDAVDIDYGENIATAVSQGISDSKVVIFWISPKFLESNWCKYEFEQFHSRYAGNSDVLILPIVEKGHEEHLPPFLKTIKYLSIDTEDSVGTISSQLAPAIQKFISKPQDTHNKRWS